MPGGGVSRWRLWLWLFALMTGDRWHWTFHMWHVTCFTWRVMDDIFVSFLFKGLLLFPPVRFISASVRVFPFLSLSVRFRCFSVSVCFCLLLSISVCFCWFFRFCLFSDFLVSVLLSAHVKIFSVSRMRDFFYELPRRGAFQGDPYANVTFLLHKIRWMSIFRNIKNFKVTSSKY